MLAIKITTFIILLISLTRDVTYSAYGRDSVISDDDGRMLREILQRLKTMQKHIDRIERNVDQKIHNLSVVMETIVEQQMVITAEIFTVSQTLPFCCCQYQNTTERPEIETTTSLRPLSSLPTNCAEAMREGDRDGVYQINVTDSTIGPFNVYCMKFKTTMLEEDIINGTWLIFQRRQDNTTDFYRNWNMYQHGFGDLKGNFWIGLDKLYAITKATEQELWIQLEDHEGNTRWAKYSNFAIGNEYEKYALKTIGRYDGTAGDSLRYHKGQKWSTFDQDNDESSGYNCAKKDKGAWWYKDCHRSNLNGIYGNNNYGLGIQWVAWHGDYYSLKYDHMAIRPRQ